MPPTRSAAATRGHKKKALTRQRLLDAAMAVLAEQGEAFSVADLTAAAEVSHGTFYNYFADREALLQALVPHIVTRFAERMASEVHDDDPAARFARISAGALEFAIAEPQVARVVLRLDPVQQGLIADGPLARLRADLAEGYETGRFTSAPSRATVDVVTGSLLLAVRRIADGEHGAPYRAEVLQRLLQALGVSAAEAAQLAAATGRAKPPVAISDR